MKQSRTMNYLKKFDSFSYNESVDTKPGEILDLPDIGIKGEVFLTEEIETAYHGGIIDNIDTYLDNPNITAGNGARFIFRTRYNLHNDHHLR